MGWSEGPESSGRSKEAKREADPIELARGPSVPIRVGWSTGVDWRVAYPRGLACLGPFERGRSMGLIRAGRARESRGERAEPNGPGPMGRAEGAVRNGPGGSGVVPKGLSGRDRTDEAGRK